MLGFQHIVSKAKGLLQRADKPGYRLAAKETMDVHNALYMVSPKIPGIEYIPHIDKSCGDCFANAVKNIRTMVEIYDSAISQGNAADAETVTPAQTETGDATQKAQKPTQRNKDKQSETLLVE